MNPKLQGEHLSRDRECSSLNLLPFDGTVTHRPGYFSEVRSADLFHALVDELAWTQEHARFFGRLVPLPRLTSWHGACAYAYSGVVHPPRAFTPALEATRSAIVDVAPGMNCVLANLYREGCDGMSWHADDEPQWGEKPTICSISFGANRRFVLKHRRTGERVSLDLASGDVLVMSGATQRHWLHAVPKTTVRVGPRINLTFRRNLNESVDIS